MTVWDGLALTVVLLLALYGCACLVTNAVRALWRPKDPRVRLVLTLGDEDGVEQQVQFARMAADQTRLPLQVEDVGMSDESRTIIDRIWHSM